MKITTYEQALEYLESHIRMDVFTRYDADKHLTDPLERMRYLLKLLDNPQQNYPSVQVTGTSGKGSTAYLLSHILTAAGYKTGFTLSPHLQNPHERMQVNDLPISDTAFIAILNESIPAIEQMTNEPIGKPSYFEILLSMALLYFAKQEVDIVVAEVGLEGKYDGTNTLNTLAVILTNISLDHTAILGETIEAITTEAVSAIRKQVVPPVVVTGVLQPTVEEIVRDHSEQVKTKVIEYGRDFRSGDVNVQKDKTLFTFHSSTGDSLHDLELPLKGRYQVDNASLALETVMQLSSLGFPVKEEVLRKAIQSAFFPGRFEVLKHAGKTVILDGAHNEAKMAAFLSALEEYFPDKKKNFVIGFKKDKDVANMLNLVISHADRLFITEFQKTTDQSKNYAMTVAEIEEVLQKTSLSPEKIISEADSIKALQLALLRVDEESVVIVTGSLYLVGELREYITEQSQFQS